MTKIEMKGYGPELYKSTELSIGQTVKEVVKGFSQKDFSQNDGEENLKWVLEFESGKGLSLNQTNTKFLLDKGFDEYEELIGHTVTLTKEVRTVGMKQGEREMVGIFIIDVA